MNDSLEIGEVVRRGLTATPKALPAYLLYDAEGSALFERITELPEYYPTRTERSIFEEHSAAIMTEAMRLAGGPMHILELGAGTSMKTQVLLQAARKIQGHVHFVPADVSQTALAEGLARLSVEVPEVLTEPLVGTHAEALAQARSWQGPRMVLFIGSSIGNYADDEAVALLSQIRDAIAEGGVLLLGTDRRKAVQTLLPAYDDSLGVTAAFNKNVLSRINRELGGQFDTDSFRHVALWNDEASRIEMHLESTVAQRVHIEGLGLSIAFAAGERVHTESSHKYDDARIQSLLDRAGLRLERRFCDERDWFSLQLAVAK